MADANTVVGPANWPWCPPVSDISVGRIKND